MFIKGSSSTYPYENTVSNACAVCFHNMEYIFNEFCEVDLM